jgi:site-specific DNA-methyltransferase (cytosine-N4-specific)
MKPYYEDGLVTLHHGDALTIAATLEPASVRTIVTSPPYYGLRDYGHADHLGAEATLDEYVGNLVTLFAALRPALADDGTLWLNLGDSYARNPAKGGSGTPNGRNVAKMRYGGGSLGDTPPKNLLGVPWRVAFALQADGWILRADIIWAKPNPMPEPVTDRPTKAHEYLFLLAKSPRYYYDAEAIREPYTGDRAPSRRARSGNVNKQNSVATAYYPGVGGAKYGDSDAPEHRSKSGSPFMADSANKRDVWTVSAQPFPGSHFAVYPPELIRPCILAGSARGDTVLDPFSGSGTTGMVATQEGRRYVGIDVNAEYLDLSLRTRFASPVLDMTGGAA